MNNYIASSVQAHFYLSGQLHPASALNTITCALRIQGMLSLQQLGESMHLIAARHPALRTQFRARGGQIECVVSRDPPSDILIICETPPDDDALSDAVHSLRSSLSPESVTWMAKLLRHASDDHTLLFTAHRSIWDERSTLLFVRELSTLYNDRTGTSADHPLPIEDDCGPASVDDDQTGGARQFAESLVGVSALHGFPLKVTRPKTFSVEAQAVDAVLDTATERLLVDTARGLGLDRFQIQIAAAAYVLAQFSGQQRLALGMPFDLRTEAHASALGSHTAILPVGLDTSATTFEALCLATSGRCRDLGRYAHTPFDAILRECGARSDPSANPLFQIACVDNDCPVTTFDGCLCSYRSVAVPPQQVNLFLQFAPNSLRLAYASRIISAELAESFVNTWQSFLGAALQSPKQELSQLPLLDESRQRQLCIDWNSTDAPELLEHDLFSLLMRHAVAANTKIALSCNGTYLSYQDLRAAIDVVAQRLTDLGVASNDMVGICLPRSVNMVLAVLAVLRCGVAYVPLDPSFPVERLRYMVTHAKLKNVITVSNLKAAFEHLDVQFVELDCPSAQPSEALAGATLVDGSQPAYVIYTSGSTGRPKGVVIPRGAVVNFLLSMLMRPGIVAADIVCAVTTLSFDIAVLELLAPLCAGGTVVIATEEEARDPRLLIDLLQSNHVTLLQATPITWQMLCAAGWSGDSSLTALCGGGTPPSFPCAGLRAES